MPGRPSDIAKCLGLEIGLGSGPLLHRAKAGGQPGDNLTGMTDVPNCVKPTRHDRLSVGRLVDFSDARYGRGVGSPAVLAPVGSASSTTDPFRRTGAPRTYPMIPSASSTT